MNSDGVLDELDNTNGGSLIGDILDAEMHAAVEWLRLTPEEVAGI